MYNDVKAVAFYLPQYHEVKENSQWWGEGFTEWRNASRGRPNFEGHYQPHIPRDLGYYDLSNIDVMRRQTDMAKDYGLYGFCFYFYWFNGRRILEKPLDNYISSDIDFPFCFCWANENWTRTWDGLEKDVLLKQEHSDEDDQNLIDYLIPIFKDTRYIKVNGKPKFVVYRVDLFPDIKRTAEIWRKAAIKAGFPGLHLCAVQFYGITDPTKWGFDAAVEFPPHQFISESNKPALIPPITNKNFSGGIVDYSKIIAQSLSREAKDYIFYRGIIPSWDNTGRRQDTSHIVINSSPFLYRYWLRYLSRFTVKNNDENNQFIYINAWNEWGEGCHLEPDLKYGHQYLEATLQGLQDLDFSFDELRNTLLLSDAELATIFMEYEKALDTSIRYASENQILADKLKNPTPYHSFYSKVRAKERLNNHPFLYKVVKKIYHKVRRNR